MIFIGRLDRYSLYEDQPLVFAQGRFSSLGEGPEPESRSANSSEAPTQQDTLLHWLLCAYDGISALVESHRFAAGLTFNQSRALAVLSDGSERTASGVASGALLGDVAAADALDYLSDLGLVARTTPDRDRIEPDGIELSQSLREAVHAIETSVAKDASGVELSAAKDWLREIAVRSAGRR